jgi:uncharacterized protein YerC
MTNVSKRVLGKDQQKQLFYQLSQLVSEANKTETRTFFGDLFTEAEQIMFIKRLAVILLLSKEYSPYRIAKTLKMSESTINQIKLKYELGEFEAIVSLSRKNKFDTKQFWTTLETLLQAGMPSMGKDRWKSLR